MASSSVLLAKRALVSLLLRLAVAYGVTVAVSRGSPDAEVTTAYRKVVLKAHPDKGGSTTDSKSVNDARAVWEAARRDAAKNRAKGRPKDERSTFFVSPCLQAVPF